MDDLIAYRNTNTDETHVRTKPDPAMEARPNFTRIPLAEANPADVDRARAEVAAASAPPPPPPVKVKAPEGMVAYRNRNLPDELHVLSGPSPDLDARPNFYRVPLDQVPDATIEAVLRANAEDQMRRTAADKAGATGGTPSPVAPRLAHRDPQPTNDATGILHRDDMRNTGAPSTYELQKRDEAERAAMPQAGVLGREPDDVLRPPAPELFEKAAVTEGSTVKKKPAKAAAAKDDDGGQTPPAE